jgi:hypothetical protein
VLYTHPVSELLAEHAAYKVLAKIQNNKELPVPPVIAVEKIDCASLSSNLSRKKTMTRWPQMTSLMKDAFYRAKELQGDCHDLVNIAKQVLNKSASNRLISKQECMVLLGGLDLVTCSETIKSVSLTLSAKVVVSEEDKKRQKKW